MDMYIEWALRLALYGGIALVVFALLGVLLSGIRESLAMIAAELNLIRKMRGEQFRILQEEKRPRPEGPQKLHPPVLNDDGIAPETWRLIERMQADRKQ